MQFEKPQTAKKIIPIIVALLLIAAIIGGAAWFYLSQKKTNTAGSETATSTPTASTEIDTSAPTGQATAVKTNLTSTIQQLNNELSAMAADQSSTEDATPTL